MAYELLIKIAEQKEKTREEKQRFANEEASKKSDRRKEAEEVTGGK